MKALVGLVLMVAAGAASAQAETSPSSAPQVALVWSGPGPELTCLGEDGLTRAVNEYLGRNAFAEGSLDLILRVTLERLGDRTWRARLESQDLAGSVLGSRELTSSTELCSSLDEPLVLAVALMVDAEPEPPPAPVPKPEPEADPEEPPPPPALPSRRTPGRSLLSADASIALEAGLLPAVRPGLDGGLELRAASWLSARVSATGFLPASASLAGGAEVRFALLYGAVALCPGFAPSRELRLSLCGGALYGVLFAQGEGLDAARSTQRPLFAGMFGAGGSVRLAGRWSAEMRASAVVPYRAERFVYELNAVRQEFFHPADLSLVASLGMSVTF